MPVSSLDFFNTSMFPRFTTDVVYDIVWLYHAASNDIQECVSDANFNEYDFSRAFNYLRSLPMLSKRKVF